jgi:hypothetical protein
MKTKTRKTTISTLLIAAASFVAIFTAAAADNYKAYILCSNPTHGAGGWCQHFQSFEAAKTAAAEHNKINKQCDCKADSGKCPLH